MPTASSPRARRRSARRSSTASATSARSPRIRTGAPSCASNLVKGRPENQVGSVTTTRDRFDKLFDWALLPGRPFPRPGARADGRLLRARADGLSRAGRARGAGPRRRHSTARLRTTQLIGPGYRCASNELLDDILGRTGEDYPVHHLGERFERRHRAGRGRALRPPRDAGGLRRGDGDRPDRSSRRGGGARVVPAAPADVDVDPRVPQAGGGPALILERHGSLDVDDVRQLVAKHGFGLHLADGARERLPMRARDGRLVVRRAGRRDRDARLASRNQRREDRPHLGAVAECRAREHTSSACANASRPDTAARSASVWMRDVRELLDGSAQPDA